jgi:hypothetical protein
MLVHIDVYDDSKLSFYSLFFGELGNFGNEDLGRFATAVSPFLDEVAVEQTSVAVEDGVDDGVARLSAERESTSEGRRSEKL